jgi:hypothetical protein
MHALLTTPIRGLLTMDVWMEEWIETQLKRKTTEVKA